MTSAAVNVCLPKRMGPFGEETVTSATNKRKMPPGSGWHRVRTLELEVPSIASVIVHDGPCDISLELLQVLRWLFRLCMPGYETFTLTSEMELIK